ncbi:extracellular solute-binding protein [Paenibacillus sp. PAMC21692]|uniref:extracellular solute-binding protein n=1 Tax=Paenibacillus sp. PAMC21692 TaxID=2762320 RepID=UPI00164E2272|nr:extracellular solute-binding protein [Paenibacillus sp. PAMC21692]QNK57913.1 extracellular solute-binding protein [Paenibacillus sp. PAMC21692]
MLRKKMLLGITAALMVVSACSGGSNAPTSTNKGEAGGAQTTAKPTDSVKEVENTDPVKIKYFVSDNNFVLPDGPMSEQNYVKYLEEKTNTKLDIELIAHGKYEETLRLKFASGDTPDLFTGYSLNYAGAQERVLPLNDLIDQYGPNLKKAIPQETWDSVTIKGQIIALPNVLLTSNNTALYVRKDWMETVGASVPTTSDEYLDLLRAFRDKDPNGNKLKDEIPFSMREKFTWWAPIKGMWGLAGNYVEHEGQIIPSVIHPNMKQVLAYLKQMYDEKLVDPEFLNNTGPVQEKKILSDLVGSFNHETLSASNWNFKLTTSLKDTKHELITIPTPRGTDYEGALGGNLAPSSRYWFIMKTAQNPEAIIKMFDWLATQDGAVFAQFGLEGDTYVKEGDKIIYDTAKNKEKKLDLRAALLRGVGAGLDPEALLVRNEEETRLYQFSKDAIALSKQEGVADVMTGLQDPKILSRFPDLKPDTGALFQEAAAKIILGDVSIDYFDTFVKEYREQGGDDLIKELTESYNELHGK